MIKKVKNNELWTYVISDLNDEEIVGTFYKKELQKRNQKEFRVEKVIKRKGIEIELCWFKNCFKCWYIRFYGKKTYLGNLKFNVDKLDIDKLKNVQSNLTSLKSKVNKLVPTPVNLGKLSDLVKSDVAKKDVYNAQIKNI